MQYTAIADAGLDCKTRKTFLTRATHRNIGGSLSIQTFPKKAAAMRRKYVTTSSWWRHAVFEQSDAVLTSSSFCVTSDKLTTISCRRRGTVALSMTSASNATSLWRRNSLRFRASSQKTHVWSTTLLPPLFVAQRPWTLLFEVSRDEGTWWRKWSMRCSSSVGT